MWKDDAVSFRTLRLSIIANYIITSARYADSDVILTRKVLERHFLELSEPTRLKCNNHGIFQMRALMNLVTLHGNLGDPIVIKEYVVEKLNWLWSRQYGTQNIHLENSTGYHKHIIKEFEDILSSPEMKDLSFSFNEKHIDQVKKNAKFLFHPNGIGSLLGDSNFVNQKHDIVTGDHIFNEAGYAILAGNKSTTANSYLLIRTGFPSNAHRHSDDFSFEWSERGQIIIQDSARYSYDYTNPFRAFVTSTRSLSRIELSTDRTHAIDQPY